MDGFENATNGLQGTTNAPTSSGDSSEKHGLAHFLEVYYSLALLVFGTIGNLLSLAVLSRKAFRSSPIGICLRFLALADLTALYTGPLYFTAIALHDYNFRKVSVASCRIHRWVSYVSVDLSAWTLVVMSTARLTSVLWPLKNIFTRRKTYIVLFITFIIIVGINSPMFILYGTVHLAHRTLHCVATNSSYRYFTDHIWSWLVLVKFGLLPGSILLVMNIVLVIRVYRSRRHVDEMNDGEKQDSAPISAFGRAKLCFGRWLKSSKFSGDAWRAKTNAFSRSPAIECPSSSILKNVDSKEGGKSTGHDDIGGKGRARSHTSTETIVSTVENDKSITVYDKPRNSNLLSTSGDKGTLSQNGDQFLQVPTTQSRAKGILAFATFPKYQLQKLQKKCGSFTFPKRGRHRVTLKTTDTSKDNNGKSEFHDTRGNGVILYVTENDDTLTTDHAFRGKTSQSYSDGMSLNASCALNTENKSRSLSPMTQTTHEHLQLTGTDDEDEVRSTSQRDKTMTGDDIKIIRNNSLSQTTLHDPRGSDSSPTTRTQETQNHTSESEITTINTGNMSDIEDRSRFEHCDPIETPGVMSRGSDIVTLQIHPGNRTLSDSDIHHTISINSNNNIGNDCVNNKTYKDVVNGSNLTKSISSSAVYDHDSETTINKANLPLRTQMSQNSLSVSRDGKQLSFTRASRCTELSISTHTLPADGNSLADYLNKHKEINISSTSMNSISDTSIHELKLAVRRKFGTSGKTSRSRKHGVDNRSQKHRNLTLTVIVFNAMFILCNLPIIIYMAGRTYIFSGDKGTNSAQYVMEICSNYSMYTNNAINFVLYCITGSRFRQELKRMLCQVFDFLTGSSFCRRKN